MAGCRFHELVELHGGLLWVASATSFELGFQGLQDDDLMIEFIVRWKMSELAVVWGTLLEGSRARRSRGQVVLGICCVGVRCIGPPRADRADPADRADRPIWRYAWV
jgi:hypothetical protein